MKRLSIILPCYNPPEGWEERIVLAYRTIADMLGFQPEIILVNDGSSRELNEHSIALLKSSISEFNYSAYKDNKGKGYALRHGAKQSQADFVIFTDIDFPYTNDSLISIWQLLNNGCDVVAGVKNTEYYNNVPRIRVKISRVLRKMIGHFFSMPITDTQCGLKGFNRKGKTIFLATTINRYLCDLEFIYKCYRAKPELNIKAQPVVLRDGIIFRKMNWRILINESYNFLSIILKRK